MLLRIAAAVRRAAGAAAALALAASPAVALGAAKPTASAGVVDYVVSPELHDGVLTALDVKLSLRGDPSGSTRLLLPDKAASATDLWRNLRDLRVEGAREVIEDGPAVRIVRAAPGARLTLHYRVVSAFGALPGPKDQDTYKPDIQPRWFWAYGEALFIVPADDANWRARVAWTGAPAGFPFASSLERAGGQTLSMSELLESVTVGGPDLTVLRRTAAGAPVRVAVIGRLAFAGDDFADTVARVIAGERAFWRDDHGPFLVALSPLAPEGASTSVRGEGRKGAFAIQSTPNFGLDPLTTIVGHEYFHIWNSDRLGGLDDGDREPAGYWFSEGFTDFYARRLLLRMGVTSLEQFAAAWNETLRDYANSTERTAPGARVLTEFWTSPAIQKLPYQRGAILAAIWSRRLAANGKGLPGLDPLMLAMRDRARAVGPAGPKAADLFVQTASAAGLDVREDVARIVGRGEPALLPADAFGDCLQVRTVEVAAFDRGYRVDADSRIAGLADDAPAYVAGLRNGMVYVTRDAGVPNDSRIPYAVRVRDGAAEHVVTFQPEGRRRISLQEVVVPPGLSPAGRAACAVEAAGAPQGLRKR